MRFFGIKAMQDAQSPEFPANPADCNCLAIRQAARQVTQLYDGYLAAAGLRSTQYSILSRIDRLGPLPINKLAEAMVMDRTTMGRALRPLERDRLVAMGPSKEDGRVRTIRLTPSGEKRLALARTLWQQAQDKFEGSYGESAAAGLRWALGRVVEAV
jgi:DNA-binding MarR family transcriptional regulator